MNKNEFIFDCMKLSISVLAFSGTFKSSPTLAIFCRRSSLSDGCERGNTLQNLFWEETFLNLLHVTRSITSTRRRKIPDRGIAIYRHNQKYLLGRQAKHNMFNVATTTKQFFLLLETCVRYITLHHCRDLGIKS